MRAKIFRIIDVYELDTYYNYLSKSVRKYYAKKYLNANSIQDYMIGLETI